MLGRERKQGQLWKQRLADMIDRNHPLALLADNMDWGEIERRLSRYYSRRGRPSHPVRFMVGCMLLKWLFRVGDEKLAKVWEENAYWQYLTGMEYFEKRFPCAPSDFVHFRKRIGVEGLVEIFTYSVELVRKVLGKKLSINVVICDTTVQGNGVGYPSDVKLAVEVSKRVKRIARKEGVEVKKGGESIEKRAKRLSQRGWRAYQRGDKQKARETLKQLVKEVKEGVDELEQALGDRRPKWEEELGLCRRAIESIGKRGSKRLYSLAKPYTRCIKRGKLSRPCEFGNKVGIMIDASSGVVLAVKAAEDNIHDSRFIPLLVEELRRNLGVAHKRVAVICDRGFRGSQPPQGTTVIIPEDKLKRKRLPAGLRALLVKYARLRNKVEGVIAHMKRELGMDNNLLWGEEAPQFNALMSAIARNLYIVARHLRETASYFVNLLRHLLLALSERQRTCIRAVSC